MIQPIEPLTALAEGMVALHEFMTSAIQAGFTKEQALEMVLTVLRETMRGKAE